MNLFFAIPREVATTVFLPEDYERLSRLARIIHPPPEGEFRWGAKEALLAETDILVTGWKTPPLDKEALSALTRLSLVANASGAVKRHLPASLWERGVRVLTASCALGWGVAEFVLALILLASKRAFWLANAVREQGEWRENSDCYGGGFELFGADVGIIGAGHSGRQLLQLLAPFDCRRWVYDPYVDPSTLAALGARRADSLEEIFERCRVVSLHAALTDSTRHLLRGHHFRRLAPGSVFINTARAGLIHEEELVEALKKETFVACLDVAQEEPPALDHPFRRLRNVVLTPHIAGAIRENRFRMGRLVADEIERFLSGKPLKYEVALNTLSNIA